MPDLVYFSSVSGNTHRFVEKLDRPAARIPLYARETPLIVHEPFVLLSPPMAEAQTPRRYRSK